jgi:hypothetical protein
LRGPNLDFLAFNIYNVSTKNIKFSAMLDPAYIAGFFDGEGTVSLIYTKRRTWIKHPDRFVFGFKFIVGVASTNLSILEKFQEQFLGDICKNAVPRKATHKQVFAWKICSADRQRHFLEAISPFVFVRKRQVELGLEYLGTSVQAGHRLSKESWDKRIEIFRELKQLNQRGAEKKPTNDIPLEPPLGWNPKYRNHFEHSS